MAMKFTVALLATIVTYGSVAGASAATIVGAVSATATSEFSVDFDIGNTIDQSGLSANYVSGVTDFDAYIGLNPSHTFIALDNEWFTEALVNSATITYDLGSVQNIDRIALWNDEFSGIGTGDVFSSTDGVIFSLLTTINPTNNPQNLDYFADIFGFSTTAARFFEIQVSNCPQPDAQFNGCGLGEIAFSSGASVVPLPAALPLFASGLGLLGYAGFRKKKEIVVS